jgi:hypothetical protein
MNATDATAAVVGTLISLLLVAGLYAWMALALSAVFRKSGIEPWKAWVPILNVVVLLQLAGLSPWLVLLAFIPIVNIAFLVVFAIALYRVGAAFGFGVGMAVLGVLLFPVWASIVGWGSARWLGREADAGSRPGAGVRRSSPDAAGAPPLPPFGEPVARPDETRPFAGPAPTHAPARGFTPPPYAPPMPPAPIVPAPGASGSPSHAAADRADRFIPPMPSAQGRPSGDHSGHAPASGVAGASRSDAEQEPVGSAGPSLAGWTSSLVPARPRAASSTDGDGADDSEPGEVGRWEGFALDRADLSDEVTGAFPGAPGPVSAVPTHGPVASLPPALASNLAPRRTSAEIFPAPPAATSEEIMRPPVSSVPAADHSGDGREPWAPARSPMSDADAFPEASGPVSAVAGAPDAGAPRSARTSVSAFHTKPEIPDEQDVFEETIIARRKRSDWTLVPPTGAPVALSADVVILGRRPAGDPAFPGAQLVSIQDGTVSKTHARLRLRDDRWYVTDLDSTNGVLFATLMGTEVEAPPGEEVEAGDRFLLGDAEVRLKRSDG